MATFAYKVKDKSGNTASGRLEAEDRRSAVSQLQQMGYWVLDAREVEVRSGQLWNPFALFMRWVIDPVFGGATAAKLSVFYRQFATMITAGMSLYQALNSLSSRAPTRRLSRIARDAARTVEGGGRLSDAFARYPAMFPELHISLIRAGEAGGSIDRTLERLADYTEREYKIRQRMRMMTFYPKILVLAVIFIPAFPTLVLEGTNAFWNATLPVLINLLTWIAVIWVGYRLLYQIPAFRYGIDVFKLGTPLVGSVVKMLALSKFYRAFASLHSAGASPSQAISNAARACGNWYITRSLMKAVPVVEMGRTFTEAMERTMIMPRMTLDMLATGEASGAVSDMVEKVADYSENEAEVRIHQLTMASGALLLLGICIYIGMTIIGSYLQHYKDILKAN